MPTSINVPATNACAPSSSPGRLGPIIPQRRAVHFRDPVSLQIYYCKRRPFAHVVCSCSRLVCLVGARSETLLHVGRQKM